VYEGIGIGFIGCGDITRRLSRLLRRDHRKVPQYFASRSAAKASDFAHELGGAGHHGSYEAALSDSRIRAVWIATPPDLHLGLTLQALASGKAVIVEKPAFASLAEFDTVHAAARRRGRVLIAENYPYKPSTERLKKLMAAGSVGEVRATHINAQKHKDVIMMSGVRSMAPSSRRAFIGSRCWRAWAQGPTTSTTSTSWTHRSFRPRRRSTPSPRLSLRRCASPITCRAA
jgi:predicted dehydrogenase